MQSTVVYSDFKLIYRCGGSVGIGIDPHQTSLLTVGKSELPSGPENEPNILLEIEKNAI
jgi:hypothetical protein